MESSADSTASVSTQYSVLIAHVNVEWHTAIRLYGVLVTVACRPSHSFIPRVKAISRSWDMFGDLCHLCVFSYGPHECGRDILLLSTKFFFVPQADASPYAALKICDPHLHMK